MKLKTKAHTSDSRIPMIQNPTFVFCSQNKKYEESDSNEQTECRMYAPELITDHGRTDGESDTVKQDDLSDEQPDDGKKEYRPLSQLRSKAHTQINLPFHTSYLSVIIWNKRRFVNKNSQWLDSNLRNTARTAKAAAASANPYTTTRTRAGARVQPCIWAKAEYPS